MMEVLDINESNNRILESSRDVADKFGKRHDSVLRDIDNILKSTPQLSSHIINSTYRNSRGKIYRSYDLDEVMLDILNTKYQYSAMSPRFEIKFKNLLYEMFPNEKIIPQYHILDYKIDFFMPDLHMIIEYDEEQHKYQKKNDGIRILNILNELNRMVTDGEPLYDGDTSEPNPWLEGKNIFSVIRVKKGKEIDGLRRICIEITENMMTPCSDYMK